jgi:hypothetical protein
VTWQQDDEIARLKAENERLRALLRTLHDHLYEGSCPDETQPDARDPNCWACQSMMTAEELREAKRRVFAEIERERMEKNNA